MAKKSDAPRRDIRLFVDFETIRHNGRDCVIGGCTSEIRNLDPAQKKKKTKRPPAFVTKTNKRETRASHEFSDPYKDAGIYVAKAKLLKAFAGKVGRNDKIRIFTTDPDLLSIPNDDGRIQFSEGTTDPALAKLRKKFAGCEKLEIREPENGISARARETNQTHIGWRINDLKKPSDGTNGYVAGFNPART